MSSCCCPEPSDASNGALRCPHSGTVGKTVDRQTLKALLTETALGRLTRTDYRFCADASCDVVYFGADGTQFATADVRVRVWQKLPFGSRPVCYCFGESEASIRAELDATGRSSAVERIRAHIAAERCACELRNPRGACCLGDVIAAVRRVESTVEAESSAIVASVIEEADVS